MHFLNVDAGATVAELTEAVPGTWQASGNKVGKLNEVAAGQLAADKEYRNVKEGTENMISTIARFKQGVAMGSLALAMVAVSAAPMLGGHDVDAKKHKKPKAPNIAIQSITLEDHPDPGHMYVVVEVENVGKRDASGFRIGMVAENPNQQVNGGVRDEDFSLPLNLPKGQTTEVQFRLGCNWINGGAVTARTDPSPVPGEPSNKTANNVLSESFPAGTCS